MSLTGFFKRTAKNQNYTNAPKHSRPVSPWVEGKRVDEEQHLQQMDMRRKEWEERTVWMRC